VLPDFASYFRYEVIRKMDKIMAEGIRIVQGLYKSGVLKMPEGWSFGPDLL